MPNQISSRGFLPGTIITGRNIAVTTIQNAGRRWNAWRMISHPSRMTNGGKGALRQGLKLMVSTRPSNSWIVQHHQNRQNTKLKFLGRVLPCGYPTGTMRPSLNHVSQAYCSLCSLHVYVITGHFSLKEPGRNYKFVEGWNTGAAADRSKYEPWQGQKSTQPLVAARSAAPVPG
jgi:hypothetical protein